MAQEQATESETWHHRKVAYALGVKERSVIQKAKEGAFETATPVSTGKDGVATHYYVDSDDPYLVELLALKEAGEPLPEDFEPMKAKGKKRKKQDDDEPEKVTRPKKSGTVSAEDVLGRSKKRVQVERSFGAKQGFRTRVYEIDPDYVPVYRVTLQGVPDPEDLQVRFEGGGSFLLSTYRRTTDENGRTDWVYDPKLSRDDPEFPVKVGPKPGFDPNVAGSAVEGQPGSPFGSGGDRSDPRAAADADFVRTLAERGIEPPDDESGGEMVSSLTNMVREALQQQSGVFREVQGSMQQQFQNFLQANQQEQKSRTEEWDRRLQYLERMSEMRIKEMKEEAKLERIRAQQEQENIRQREKTNAEDRIQYAREHFDRLQEANDKMIAARIEASDTRVQSIIDKLDRIEQIQSERFEDRVAYLDKIHELRMEQANNPNSTWISILQGLTKEIRDAVPQVLNQMNGGVLGAGTGTGLLNAPSDTKAQGEPTASVGEAPAGAEPQQEGGSNVGLNMLSMVKGNERGRVVIQEIFTDMAKAIKDEDPPSMTAHGIVSLLQTQADFALVWNQLYRNDLKDILDGLIEGEEAQILLSDKGRKFWEQVRTIVKNYFKDMESQAAQG